MDDIVTRLRQFIRSCNHGWNLGNDWYPAPTECVSCIRQRDAVNEIERLRTALQLAVGELSTHGQYAAWTPDQLMQQFLEEAHRG